MSKNTDLKINEEAVKEVAKETPKEVEETTKEDAIKEDAAGSKAEEKQEDKPQAEKSQDDQTDQEDEIPEGDEGLVIINGNVPEEAKWYVVHTYAGHEKKVAVTLKQRAEASGFTDRVFKVFIAHQQKIVISEGKKRSVDERLFPGYVIVLMVMSDDAWLLVRSTRGVTGFVGMGSTPTPLPKQEVKALMRFTKMEAPKFEAKFSVGDSVKIMEGPFRDFLGKVDEVNDDQGKVKVLISFFGKETPVEMDFVQVQSI